MRAYSNGSWESLADIVCNKCNQCLCKSSFKVNRYICVTCCKGNMSEFNKKKLDGRYDEKQKIYNAKYEASDGGVQRRREYRQKLKDLREAEGRTRKPNPVNRLRTGYYQKVTSMLPVPVKMGAALQYLSMSVPIFKKWIEYNFQEDMSWDTLGSTWRLELVPPPIVGPGDLTSEASKYDAFNWRNWSPASTRRGGEVTDYREKANAFFAKLS